MKVAKLCIHSFVSGVVQGVWFRASTQQKATDLQLTGWVRNLSDGRVEVMVCGETARLEAFQAWLWEGPTAAQVSMVEQADSPWESWEGFVARETI